MVKVNPPVLGFAAIPSPKVSLGTKIVPIDLSQYVQNGAAPFTYSLVSQTLPNAINCSLGGSIVSSDYAYSGGINIVTVQVTDSKQATVSTTISVTVDIPAVLSPQYGIDFSPYETGQSPDDGTSLSVDEITQRMGIIVPYAQWVRTYRSTHGEENSGIIAHKFGRKICMGAWIGPEATQHSANVVEVSNLIAHAANGEADCAVIGNEALFNNYISPAQLTTYIDQFRAAVPNVPVTVADTYNSFLIFPQVASDCDFLFVNYYPYWEGQDLSVAIAYLNSEDDLLRHTYPGKEIIVSETGWPSGGNITGNAVPSLANAASYFVNFESWAKAGQRNAFYFEAFDEAWKATANPGFPQEALFGIFDASGVMKYGSDVFSGAIVADNWTCTNAPGGLGTPTIQLTSVPPIGSTNPLLGQVQHLTLGNYYVVVYIHVGASGWWVKPYSSAPLTFITCAGTWTTNITTGPNDSSADQITAFLIPSTYSPPILSGAQVLPTDLYNNAVANVSANRP